MLPSYRVNLDPRQKGARYTESQQKSTSVDGEGLFFTEKIHALLEKTIDTFFNVIRTLCCFMYVVSYSCNLHNI